MHDSLPHFLERWLEDSEVVIYDVISGVFSCRVLRSHHESSVNVDSITKRSNFHGRCVKVTR